MTLLSFTDLAWERDPHTALLIKLDQAEAGDTITAVPRGKGMIGHPLKARSCRCRTPIDDDGTCVRCGRDTSL